MHHPWFLGAAVATAGLVGCNNDPAETSAGSSSGVTVPPTGETGAPPTGTDPDPTSGGTTSGVGGTQGESSSGDDGPKFDLMPEDPTEAPPPTGPGSCRPSEIYGAAGGFPKFSDPAYANFLDRSVLVMTTNAQEDGFALHVVDISGPPPQPNLWYPAPIYHDPAWSEQNLGQVFGLTLDSDGNIYVAPSTVYGPTATPSTIKRIDGVTGAITEFAVLPNNGPALGNLNYDCVSETIYVSNHEDGRIYQLDMNGEVVSTYHHASMTATVGPANDPAEPDGVFAPLGERPWAVQSHAGRLYYSVWWSHLGAQTNHPNEIWSVAYADQQGVPDPATARLEFQVQGLGSPVSDLSFAATGWMLISQRSMFGDMSTSAHQSTTYEYDFNNGAWENKGTTFIVGELPNSAAGGVDHDFAPGGYVWMSGDALDFYTPDVVYGVQGTPHAGGDITNSTLIDLDNEVFDQDKGELGDVEVPIPGDASPVPPPG
jgi:hypothetical protein